MIRFLIRFFFSLACSAVFVDKVDEYFSRRKTQLPSKKLATMFIKYSAERLPVDGKDMWLIKVNIL